jgi:hypothetical protein
MILKTQNDLLLAPFEIWEVQLGNRTIKFFEPLLLTPFWQETDPSDQGPRHLGIEYPELDISAFGANREELWRCVRGEIRFVWRHCVRQDNEKLSPQHRKLKSNYLAIAEEIEDEEVADE